MRFLIFFILFFPSFISLAQQKEFNVYTSFDDDVAQLAMERLGEALMPLNFHLSKVILPSKRSLKMANEKGDAELMRVADLSASLSSYTSNLIRVNTPVVRISVYAVSLAPLKFADFDVNAILGRAIGLEENVFLLAEMFPEAKVKDNISNLLRLVRLEKIESAIISAQSLTWLHKTYDFADGLNVSLVRKEPLYLYIHTKHKDIKNVLERSFAKYAKVETL
jgi:hypothetical protein